MLKLMDDFVRYFLSAKNHSISSAFKFMFFSFGGLLRNDELFKITLQFHENCQTIFQNNAVFY